MENTKFHIGNLIVQALNSQERTLNWLAKKLNYDRSNLAKLLEQSSIQTDLLLRICAVLQENIVKPLFDCAENLIASEKHSKNK